MSLTVDAFSGRAGEWDAFVRACPGWTHFHLHGWRWVMERELGHACYYLEARGADGELAGLLPLVRVRSLLFGDYLVSIPFVSYGGPLGTTAAITALVERATGMASDLGVNLLELRNRGSVEEVALPVSHRKITVVLDLPSDPEALWKRLRAKVRSQVRRPRKEGVLVRFGPDQVRAFHRVFSRHMRDLGTPALSEGFFHGLAEGFGDSVWFGCAYLGDRPIAGGCGFSWGREFEITWASSLRSFNAIAPNMLLYWSFMERAVERRLERFNFGRCTPGGGTHRFKTQWGGQDEQLWWYQWSRSGELAVTPSPDAGGKYALATRVWSRLPMPFTRLVGPRIVRLIP